MLCPGTKDSRVRRRLRTPPGERVDPDSRVGFSIQPKKIEPVMVHPTGLGSGSPLPQFFSPEEFSPATGRSVLQGTERSSLANSRLRVSMVVFRNAVTLVRQNVPARRPVQRTSPTDLINLRGCPPSPERRGMHSVDGRLNERIRCIPRPVCRKTGTHYLDTHVPGSTPWVPVRKTGFQPISRFVE